MLNFFVTLVNTIGLPVLLIGTPKARSYLSLICVLLGVVQVLVLSIGTLFLNTIMRAIEIKSGLRSLTLYGGCNCSKIDNLN